MSRLHTSFVLGYHGCDQAIAEKIINNPHDEMIWSEQGWDWLGSGAYFWESDSQRALEWARQKQKNKQAKGEDFNPAVIGAVINLGNCLDLMNRKNIQLVEAAYQSLKATYLAEGEKLPKNEPGHKNDRQELKRYLDNAVFEHLHQLMNDSPDHEPFDTVRGMFTEGDLPYQGAGYRTHNHVQIAVRNPEAIIGYFHPRALDED